MSVLSAVPIAEIKARGSINSADVLKLWRSYCDDGRITAEEAGIIFALNEACPVQDPAWGAWFVETLTDFVVDQAKPEGHLTSENAAWLTAHLARDGRIGTGAGIDLLVSVLDRARWAPISLVRLALDQVKDAVLTASGPLRCRSSHPPCVVGETDVDLLRGIMCAFDGDGDLPVTRPEAEVLCDIDAATAGRQNHPAWGDLFVKAIANCAMAASGYATPQRKLALARDPWLERRGHLARRAAGAGSAFSGMLDSYRLQSGEERDIARLARQKIGIVTNEPVVVAEAAWLAGRIGRDGRPSPNAQALLLLLKAEGAVLHPSLQALVDKIAAAT
jgi:hypothetical protein